MTPLVPVGEVGWVTNLQRYCLHDGPGIRTTVFLKGCPLQCAWCHNPENISREPQVVLVEARCVRCGRCLQICPQGASGGPVGRELIRPPEPAAAAGRNVKESFCTACGLCVAECPAGARELLGRSLAVDKLVEEILADRVFYDDSGGGVTFSGGEPLMQFGFLLAALRDCRARGVHTAVDTCGFAPRQHLLAIAPHTGLFLYDVKCLDDKRHREFCGVSNQPILENLQALAEVHRHLWLRIPVIPGFNDAEEEIEALARFVSHLRSVRQVNLLPYHRTAAGKFDRLGRAFRWREVAPPSPDFMNTVAARFARHGLTVHLGG